MNCRVFNHSPGHFGMVCSFYVLWVCNGKRDDDRMD